MANIFLGIQLLLKAFGLLEGFEDYMAQKRIAEAEQKRQDRERAIADLAKATTPEEILDAETRIANAKP